MAKDFGITEADFKAFIKVRDGGKTNMFDSRAVERLSKYTLRSEKIVVIITNFDALVKLYPNAETRK